MNKIKLTINGKQVEAAPGSTILEVVNEYGLDDIPTLCHSQELEPYGSCFVCVVEVKGWQNLVPACATRVVADMEVTTRNERIEDSRKTAFELLLSNHYADCVSPCMEGCPAGVDAQGYIALSAMGQYRKAIDLIRKKNPLPAVCGRVCVRKCEDVCRREDVDAPVAINNIKRFLSDEDEAYATVPECAQATGKTVGIVGAGPAGLTAAWFLGLNGIKSVLYEAKERSGGMLRYGIPEYRLPDDVLDREVDYICNVGAEIQCNIRVGRDILLDDIRKKHDAVFIGAGAWTGKAMRVEGEFDTEGVVTGADFLPDKVDDPSPLTGAVVVVGGGNTAMDAARTAWRLNADKVIVLYRRTKAQMPADKMEIEDCLEEGIEIMELAAPIGINRKDGKLISLRCQRMKLGEPDDSGRRRPVPLEGSEFDLPCNLVISAIGQNTVLDGLVETEIGDVELSRWNTYVVNTRTMETNIEGVFAGGDAADDGPTVVIDAIRDGQIAADSISAYLGYSEAAPKPFTVSKEFWAKPGKAELGDIKESPRHEVHLIDVEERRNSFTEVSDGFEVEDNEHECARCLSCGCVRFDDCALRLYSEEYNVDMEYFKGTVRKHKVDERHPYIDYDPNKCVLCARCIRTCAKVLPVSAIGLVGRGFRTEMRPAMNDPLVETNCVSCGNCVDACPTAALSIKYPFQGRACLETSDIATHCGFCSIGCGITVRRFGDGRYFTTSTGKPGEYLCRYGRFGEEIFVKQDRIKQSAIRDGHKYSNVDFKKATGRIVSSLKAVAQEHGPESVGVFISPELTNEEMYIAGRIARDGIGTGNIGSLSIIGGGRESGVLDRILGFTASTSDRNCLKSADLIIACNTAMESDHLVLSADVIEASRKGAKLIISNSVIDVTDSTLASIAVDPLRGRNAIFWQGVTQALLDEGCISAEEEYKSGMEISLDYAAGLAGIDEKQIASSANLIKTADNIVFITSPDRYQDASSGDLKTLANLAVMLNSAGKKVEILLPRILANSAGLEVTGADPSFLPGRIPVTDILPGASSRRDLLSILKEGKLKAALIIGENPLEFSKPGSWFSNIEFLATIDWTDTETTMASDVVLPGATFLETPGTRCSFEGNLLDFTEAATAPSGMNGIETLAELAGLFGVEIDSSKVQDELDGIVTEALGSKTQFYWNKGEKRNWDGNGEVVILVQEVNPLVIQPPMTHSQLYRYEISQVGTERYRVRE